LISDETIEKYLSALFGNSDPGQTTHHMLTATIGRTPLGLLDTDSEPHVQWLAIAPDNPDVDNLVAQTIMMVAGEAVRDKRVMVFAGLAMEQLAVDLEDADEADRRLAQRLMADGELLFKHPKAFEATRLYAVCHDGRRWAGEHYLTGRRAGEVDGPRLLTGALTRTDAGTVRRMIRVLVGLHG
jgi:hypothetical protein